MKVSITNPAGLRCHLTSVRFPCVKVYGDLTQEITVADQDHLNWLVAGLRVVNPSATVAVVTDELATSTAADVVTEVVPAPAVTDNTDTSDAEGAAALDSAAPDNTEASATTTRKRSKPNTTQE